MANTTYETASLSGNGMFDAPAVCWHKGHITPADGNSISCDFGNRGTVSGDVTWPVSRDGNKFMHETGAYTISGENGKSHDCVYRQSEQPGLWPKMNLILGFSFRWQQNSNAGHGLFMRNCGISMVNRNGGDRRYWGSPEYSRGNTYDWQSTRFNFSAADRGAMGGYYFERFWFRASSDGGTGTRETNLKVGDFRLYYQAGTPSGFRRWVIGKYVGRQYFGNEIISPRLFPEEV